MVVIGEEEIKPISFRKLMQLERIDTDIYESVTPAWPPASPPATGRRAYGGHVYAQSAWAASQTVKRGFVVHNITGHFLLGGLVTKPFRYHVHRIRDGGIYALRRVDTYQDSTPADSGTTPCFTATISFKRSEDPSRYLDYHHQNLPHDHLPTHYSSVLTDKTPDDHPIAPGADALWWDTSHETQWLHDAQNFPGVDIRKVDMTTYNGHADPGGKPPSSNTTAGTGSATRWRQLHFYRMRKEGPGDLDEANLNLHACAHMYASDRNSLFLVQRALGHEAVQAHMGSLAHTVVFHGPAEGLRMVDSRDNDKWFVSEAWTAASGENRVCHNSRLWDYEEGKVVGSTMQDGMMRLLVKDGENSEGREKEKESKL